MRADPLPIGAMMPSVRRATASTGHNFAGTALTRAPTSVEVAHGFAASKRSEIA
jgi:hypothetical protein